MKTKSFLLYPLILFFILFLFDKLFLSEELKQYIKSDFTYIYYESREELFEKLKARKSEKKLMIILGSSRLLYFDHKELQEFYPNWDIYNFSSAVTTPAYYYFYLEKILEANIKPDFILIESDPNQFNMNSAIFKSSNLTYSFSLGFILRNANLFGKDLVSYYLGKFLFASSKNKPYLDVAYKRFTNPTFQIVAKEGYRLKELLVTNNGHSKNFIEDFVEKDFGILKATSERTIKWLFSNYKPSEMQYAFYERMLSDLKKNEIKSLIIWPQSSIPMQKYLRESEETSGFVNDWLARIQEINLKYEFTFHDLGNSSEYYCNSFVDGGHFSKDCYRPTIRYAMDQYSKLTHPKE